MFDIGWTEFILIALVILIFVGPKHLPEMMRRVGRVLAEIRAASRDLRNQIEVEGLDLESPSKIARDIVEDAVSPYDEVRKAEKEARRELAGIAISDDKGRRSQVSDRSEDDDDRSKSDEGES